MQATHEGYLQLPGNLPFEARKAYIFLDMPASLLSVGQLCDADCFAEFSKNKVKIRFKNQIICEGPRSKDDMWRIELAHGTLGVEDETHPRAYHVTRSIPSKTNPEANYTTKIRGKQRLFRYYHATCLFPRKQVWLKAVKNGHFAT